MSRELGLDDCRNCTGVAQRMAEYVDGTLPADERAAMERHLQQCPPCSDVAGEEAAGREVLRRCAGRLKAQQPMPKELRNRCEALCRGGNPIAAWWRSLFR